MAVAAGVAVAVGLIGIGTSIRTRREIEWSPVCMIYFSRLD